MAGPQRYDMAAFAKLKSTAQNPGGSIAVVSCLTKISVAGGEVGRPLDARVASK